MGVCLGGVGASADDNQGAVFVQTDGANGNAIAVFARQPGGTLVAAGTYPTGGLGGRAAGAVVDPLASQGGIAYDGTHQLLLAVNAGSNTVSVLAVDGTRLSVVQVLDSGGLFPASVAVHGDLAYVLDAGGAGAVQGFRIAGRRLHPIEASNRSLGLSNASPPFFLSSPGQIGFSPDGHHVVVTTKSNGTINVYDVDPNGRLTAPSVNGSAGPVPFAFVFDPAGHLLVTEAATSSLSSYAVNGNDSLTVLDASIRNGQAATCWIASARGFYYVANAGSADVSSYSVSPNGTITLLSAVAASTGAGAIDLAASPDGRYLYVESGGTGTVDIFEVGASGALTSLGSVAAAAGLEGIATS